MGQMRPIWLLINEISFTIYSGKDEVMEYQTILPALEVLLDEVDEIASRLNEKGAELFKQGDYEQARELLGKAESIAGFRGKVLCLEDDWKAVQVPTVKKPSTSDARIKEKQHIKAPLKKGLMTSKDEFYFPILEALARLEGTGSVQQVLNIVEDLMREELNQYDYAPLPSSSNSVRWKKTAQWARYNMVQNGWLASDSPRGVWEMTDEGRTALEKAKVEPDLQRKLFTDR
jgi:tetratricopeptide (TPR) repeat protein